MVQTVLFERQTVKSSGFKWFVLWVNPRYRARATSWIEQYANLFYNLPPLGKTNCPNGLNHQTE